MFPVSLLCLILNLCRDSCASSCLQRAHGKRFSTNTNVLPCSHPKSQLHFAWRGWHCGSVECWLVDRWAWKWKGCDSRFHREWQRHEEKTIKDKKKIKYSKKSADSGYSRYLSLFLTLGLTSALCYDCYSFFFMAGWQTDRTSPERGCTTYFLYCPHLAVNTLCVEMSSQKLPMNNFPITRTLE